MGGVGGVRWEGGGGRWQAGRRAVWGGRWVGGGWHRTGPYRQAHHRRKPQAMLTVPNRTVTPMITTAIILYCFARSFPASKTSAPLKRSRMSWSERNHELCMSVCVCAHMHVESFRIVTTWLVHNERNLTRAMCSHIGSQLQINPWQKHLQRQMASNGPRCESRVTSCT